MGDALIGLGILLALLGPLLLIPTIWAAARFLVRPALATLGVRAHRIRAATWVVAGALVLGTLLGSHAAGRVRFAAACRSMGAPEIRRRVQVSHFYVTPLYPHQAQPLLGGGRFEFIEGSRPGVPGVTRYRLDARDNLLEEPGDGNPSGYALRETRTDTWWGMTTSERVISEIESGEVLARAATSFFTGGPLSLFLGAFGIASCPDARTPEGAHEFLMYQDLPEVVLGGSAGALIREPAVRRRKEPPGDVLALMPEVSGGGPRPSRTSGVTQLQ